MKDLLFEDPEVVRYTVAVTVQRMDSLTAFARKRPYTIVYRLLYNEAVR